INEAGTPIGAAQKISDVLCFWLQPTSAGYAVFTGMSIAHPIAMTSLSPSGLPVGVTPALTPAGHGFNPEGYAWFDDGSFLIAWPEITQVVASHFSGNGYPLFSAQRVAQWRTPGGLSVTLTSLGDAALVTYWDPDANAVKTARVEPGGSVGSAAVLV